MSAKETEIVNQIMIATSKMGARIFRNTRGLFLTLDASRKVRAGLQAPGASDLIGFVPVTITPEMVGRTIAVFVAAEVKTLTGRASPEQLNFIDFVQKSGGIAGVCRSAEDAEKLLKTPLDNTHTVRIQ
jgi:hypothetical protein